LLCKKRADFLHPTKNNNLIPKDRCIALAYPKSNTGEIDFALLQIREDMGC
jgi:hypothetical protein